jgi:hypothetical protein
MSLKNRVTRLEHQQATTRSGPIDIRRLAMIIYAINNSIVKPPARKPLSPDASPAMRQIYEILDRAEARYGL